MTRTRQMIIAFWIFIVCALLWQFYTYNAGLDQQAKEHPQQQHFFFYNTNTGPVHPEPPKIDGAYVEQVAYDYHEGEPAPGSFTIYATLKNIGNAKATDVQLHVRPFRGMRLGDEDGGQSNLRILPEDDPLSQYGTWVSFPDLAPGESNTQTVSFLDHPGATPVVVGKSDLGIPGQPLEKLTPEIIFKSEKPPAAPAHPVIHGAGG